ncbi:MAG TPA: metalloregulator ArsR/SmtB family transcription factor [Streptosporangiaceae bacterium]
MTHTDNWTHSGGQEAAPVAHARWFRVLADPNRLEILRVLLTGPCSVGELVERTGLPRSRVSNHLACLRWCLFVHADRQGRNMVYTIADTRLNKLLDLADDLVCDNAEHLGTCERIGPDWL